MTTIDVGALSASPTHKTGAVSSTNLEDIYKFSFFGPAVSNSFINVNASIHDAVGNTPTITPSFKIFRDNGDGNFKASGTGADTFVSGVDSNSFFNEGPINFTTRPGNQPTFFAVVDRPSGLLSANDPVSTSYQVDFSATDVSLPSNLVPVKLPLGILTQEDGFSGSVSTGNTSDVFSFTLLQGEATTITLDGLSSDADIRVLRDNGDRIFQQGELVASSTHGSNQSESLDVNGPGNYLVQVYQFKGNTNYDLKLSPFFPSVFFAGNTGTPILVARNSGGTLNGGHAGGILMGQGNKDKLLGHAGDDVLLGGDGNDTLNGGTGNDQMFGGKGNDTLIGGKGNDMFVLAAQNGFDSFKDFHIGQDQVGLVKNLAFEKLDFVQQGKGTLVKAGKESLAFLQGVNSNQLSAGDFVQADLAKLTASTAGLVG